jgi:hypothetical protein
MDSEIGNKKGIQTMKRKIFSAVTALSALVLFTSACATPSVQPVSRELKQIEKEVDHQTTVTLDELHKITDEIKSAAAQADGDVKSALESAASRLDSLISDLEAGKKVAQQDVSNAFAFAHYALAKHYVVMARASLNDSNYELVGYDLGAAASHIQEGMAWTGHTPTPTDAATLQQAKTIAGQLNVNTRDSDAVVTTAKSDLDVLTILLQKLGTYLDVQ